MSKIFNLNYQDFLKGAVLATITAVLTYILQVLNGSPFDLNLMVSAGLTAFIAYLIKNFATDKEGTLLGSSR